MKAVKKIIVTAAAVAMLIPVSVTASAVDVYLDGSKVEFEVQPYISSDRTLVPIRPVFEALGYNAEWDGEAKTATFTKTDTVTFDTGETEETTNILQVSFETPISNAILYTKLDSVQVDNRYIVTDVMPEIKDGASMLPLRALAEAIGRQVSWDGETQTVYITEGEPEDTYMTLPVSAMKSSVRENAGALKTDEVIALIPASNNYSRGVEVRFDDQHGGYRTATRWEDGRITNIGRMYADKYADADAFMQELLKEDYSDYHYVQHRLCLRCPCEYTAKMTEDEYRAVHEGGERIKCPECGSINSTFLVIKDPDGNISGNWFEERWDEFLDE